MRSQEQLQGVSMGRRDAEGSSATQLKFGAWDSWDSWDCHHLSSKFPCPNGRTNLCHYRKHMMKNLIHPYTTYYLQMMQRSAKEPIDLDLVYAARCNYLPTMVRDIQRDLPWGSMYHCADSWFWFWWYLTISCIAWCPPVISQLANWKPWPCSSMLYIDYWFSMTYEETKKTTCFSSSQAVRNYQILDWRCASSWAKVVSYAFAYDFVTLPWRWEILRILVEDVPCGFP
jgi:hypothetical protein